MYGSLLSIHSCPEITRDLQCWGVESPPPETPGDTPANDFDQAGDMVGPSECTMSDVIDIGKGCLDKFDYNPLSDIFNPCGWVPFLLLFTNVKLISEFTKVTDEVSESGKND